MALIAAIFGSLTGLMAGIVATVLFGVSLIVGFAIYVGVSLGMIVAFSITMLIRPQSALVAEAALEDDLDDRWVRFEKERNQKMNAGEQDFQAGLDAPLSEMERKTGRDRDSA